MLVITIVVTIIMVVIIECSVLLPKPLANEGHLLDLGLAVEVEKNARTRGP